MDVTPDTTAGLVSPVADLRTVPIAALSGPQNQAGAENVRRTVSGRTASRVPVAAFQSSI